MFPANQKKKQTKQQVVPVWQWINGDSCEHGPMMSSLIKNFSLAFEQKKLQAKMRNGNNMANWEGMGPKNIGGRTVCMAFHPTNPDIIFIGSASGGLWENDNSGK